MGIDCLALILASSPNKQKTESLVIKELGIQNNSKGLKKTREDQLYEQVLERISNGGLPELNDDDEVEFKVVA